MSSPNGHVIQLQKPGHVADDEEQRPLESATPCLPTSPSSVSSSSLDRGNEKSINGPQQPPTLNKQPVNVDGSGLTTAPTATTSISAALVPLSPTVITTSPVTPTPASMSFTSHQSRHSSQSDLTSGSEVTSPLESSDTPKISGDVFSSAGIYKEVENIDAESQVEKERTKIIIPDLPLSSTTNTSSNPTPTSSSRPASTSIDTTLFSNRPAPPSPALSRRVSGAPSIASSSHSSSSNPNSPRSPTSRRPSMGMSRANLRMSGVGSDAKRQSLGIQLSHFMDGGVRGSTTPTASSSPLASPHKSSFTQSQVNAQGSSSSTQQETSSSTTTEPFINPTPSDSDPIPTPTITPTTTTIFSPPQPSSTPSARVYIKVRDYGFPPTDERHLGLGTDIPKANRVHRLNRKLGAPDRTRARVAAAALDPSSSSAASAPGAGNGKPGSRRTDSIGSMGSVDSSDADVEEEEEEDGENERWGIGTGWDGFKLGMGRFSWAIGSSHSNNRNRNEAGSDNNNDSKDTTGIFPSRKDLDMNFMDSSSSSSDDDERRGRAVEQPITEEFDDNDDDDDIDIDGSVRRDTCDDEDADAEYEEDGEPQEPLYPGLYRALYAFEPEGTAEMKLVEDQIVRVVGRGGGVGWAVVVDERGSDREEEGGGGGKVKHALVPEGYLEVVRLDWGDEEEDEGMEVGENEDGDGDVAVKAENAESV